MPNKRFVTANELLKDAFTLAHQVFTDEFRPTHVVGIWRGGAPVALAIHEYLVFKGVPSTPICISAHSYQGTTQGASVTLDTTALESALSNTQEQVPQILLVDDILDTGRTLEALISHLTQTQNVPIEAIKMACPWIKPAQNQTSLKADYFIHSTDEWVVFPHELVGIDQKSLIHGKPPEIAAFLKTLD